MLDKVEAGLGANNFAQCGRRALPWICGEAAAFISLNHGDDARLQWNGELAMNGG